MQVAEIPKIVELPKGNFDFEEAHRLYDASPKIFSEVGDKVNVTLDTTKCKDYIKQHLYPLHRGNHMVWHNQAFEFYKKDEFMSEFKRLPKDIMKWYQNNYFSIFDIIADINALTIDTITKKINLCAGLKWKVPKKYDSFSDDIKSKVEIFLAYMKDVLCSGNELHYAYILKWYSVVCKGKKNDVMLNIKAPQRCGKSTMTEMIIDHVLGQSICLRANTEALTTVNNKILCGKLLATWEELETLSKSEWMKANSKIKTLVTEKRIMYGEKFEKCFEGDNITNCVVNTNENPLKDEWSDRFLTLQVSTKHQGDHAYFGNIKDNCFNDAVGEALFNYLIEIDTSKFQAQRDMPVTQGKLDAIVEYLEPVFQFLKEEYVLPKKGINRVTLEQLYKDYTVFCICLQKNHY